MKSRQTNAKKIAWLLKHPDVWEGYPKQFETPGHKSHDKMVFEAMQKARLFSKRTICADVRVDKLIDQARFVRRMEQQQSQPEKN